MREQGYYSLIQYCPCPARAESVNIGVLLFSPKHGFLEVRMIETDYSRIFAMFPEASQYAIDGMKDWITCWIEADQQTVKTKEDLDLFLEAFFNHLRPTPLRVVVVDDPERKLKELFDELVTMRKNDDE